jgi:hypothetical protein
MFLQQKWYESMRAGKFYNDFEKVWAPLDMILENVISWIKLQLLVGFTKTCQIRY